MDSLERPPLHFVPSLNVIPGRFFLFLSLISHLRNLGLQRYESPQPAQPLSPLFLQLASCKDRE